MATKNEVLAILEKSRGGYVSGQELAEALGVSRTAVWKAIHTLEKQGYKVRAVRNRGYRLDPVSDIISAEGVAAHLPEQYRHCHVIYKDSLDSTNTFARHLAPDDAHHGTTILARQQTAGRGRSGKSFYSPADTGLYMSIVLRPDKQVSRPQMITACAAVSVCRAIESQTGFTPSIKWVNDILLDGKKICGILTEAVTDYESGGIDCIIVGVGINCYSPKEGGFPEELRGIAGALDFPGLLRNKLAADIASGILDAFESLNNESPIEEYKRLSVMNGRRVSFVYNGQRKSATVLGIDDNCGLVVTFDEGTKTTLAGGEVSIEV